MIGFYDAISFFKIFFFAGRGNRGEALSPLNDFPYLFSVHHLTASQSTLGHCHGDDLTQPMLITVFCRNFKLITFEIP